MMKRSIFLHTKSRGIFPEETDRFETLYPTLERPANSVAALQRHKSPELLRHIVTLLILLLSF